MLEPIEETIIEATEESIEVIEPVKEELKLPDSVIPTSFRTTGKPQILTVEDFEDFNLPDRYQVSIESGDTIKIFKLTDPVTDEFVSDRYAVQYEVISYKGATMTRLYRDRLDADFKVIDSENFG